MPRGAMQPPARGDCASMPAFAELSGFPEPSSADSDGLFAPRFYPTQDHMGVWVRALSLRDFRIGPDVSRFPGKPGDVLGRLHLLARGF